MKRLISQRLNAQLRRLRLSSALVIAAVPLTVWVIAGICGVVGGFENDGDSRL